MKKIATLFVLLSGIIYGYSQGIVLLDLNKNIISNTIVDINIASNTSSTDEFLVKNAGSISDTLKVVRTIYSKDVDDVTKFCWGGLCYLAATSTSSLSAIIAPGDTIDFEQNGFHAIFNSGAACVTRLVHYKFYNIHNFSDSTGFTLRYLCASGVDEISKAGGIISDVYPNPANSNLAFKYDVNESSEKGKIIFYNMLGESVKEVTLNDKHGTAKINVLDMDSGIYFYSFLVDDKIVSTKKLVINHY